MTLKGTRLSVHPCLGNHASAYAYARTGHVYIQFACHVYTADRQARSAEGQGEATTRGARLGSYSNSDASVWTRPCGWLRRATENAHEMERDEVRRTVKCR